MASTHTLDSDSVLNLQSVPDDLWRMLLEVDQASEDSLQLTKHILDAQKQDVLFAFQFTEEEATQLIKLIDTKVRDLRNPVRTLRSSTICRCFDMEAFRAS